MDIVGVVPTLPRLKSMALEGLGIAWVPRLSVRAELERGELVICGGPQFAKWQSFRESEDSRYMALTVPRFLLRNPYDPEENPVKSFVYKETVANSHEHYLWGNTAYAFGTKLTDSFAKFRWCPNIIGPQSGGDRPARQIGRAHV